MGNSNPSELQHLTTIEHPERWQSVGFKQNYEILRNSVTGEEIEQSYVHTGFTRSHDQQMDEYLFRNKQVGNIVKVIYADRVNSKNFCVGSDKYIVRTERIHVRLSEISNMTSQESLYILREALMGFQAVYLYGKKATITDQMIGMTAEGEVKVWVNSNFADNTPQSYGIQIRGRPLILTESDIVQQIFMAVRDHTANKIFPSKLVDKTNEKMTFGDAIRVINTYAWEQNVILTTETLKRIYSKEIEVKEIAYHDKIPNTPTHHTSESTHPTHHSPIPSAKSGKIVNSPEFTNTNRVQQFTPSKAQSNPPFLISQRASPNNRSRPVSNSGHRRIPIMVQPKLEESTNKRAAAGIPNTIVNIQSKAIQLKQQTNTIESSRKLLNNGVDSVKVQKVNLSPPKAIPIPNEKINGINNNKQVRTDKILIQNRESPSYFTGNSPRAHSQGHYILEKTIEKRANNHIGSNQQQIHVMQHKNKLPLDSSSQKRIPQSMQSSLDKRPVSNLVRSIEKRKAQPVIHNSSLKGLQQAQRPQNIVINLENSQNFRTQTQPESEDRQLQSDPRLFKPEFSFDPKYQSKSVYPLYENNDNARITGIPSVASITNSSKGYPNQSTNTKTTQLGQPARQPQNIIINKQNGGSRLDEQKIFLQDKIKEIEEQLKYITTFNGKYTPVGSREQSMRGSTTNPEVVFSNQNDGMKLCISKNSNQFDKVKTSNTSLEKLERFQKRGFFTSKEH